MTCYTDIIFQIETKIYFTGYSYGIEQSNNIYVVHKFFEIVLFRNQLVNYRLILALACWVNFWLSFWCWECLFWLFITDHSRTGKKTVFLFLFFETVSYDSPKKASDF